MEKEKEELIYQGEKERDECDEEKYNLRRDANAKIFIARLLLDAQRCKLERNEAASTNGELLEKLTRKSAQAEMQLHKIKAREATALLTQALFRHVHTDLWRMMSPEERSRTATLAAIAQAFEADFYKEDKNAADKARVRWSSGPIREVNGRRKMLIPRGLLCFLLHFVYV